MGREYTSKILRATFDETAKIFEELAIFKIKHDVNIY
jgi:hypothetical protein